MTAHDGGWAPPCPVCGRPVGDVGAGPCPACGLPAARQAAVVVARIGVTLTDLARDRDALLATLRAAAPGAAPAGAPVPPPPLPAPPVGAPVSYPLGPLPGVIRGRRCSRARSHCRLPHCRPRRRHPLRDAG